MSFRKYAEYKESGIEWLGEVPKHWEPLRLKWVVHSVLTGGTPNKEAFEEGYIDWLTPGDFKDEVVLKSAQKQIAPEKATKGLQLFPPNSVLIVGIGATLGKVGLLKTKSAANQQINGVIPNNRIVPIYLAFSLLAQNAFMKQIANISTLSIMNQDKTKQIPLAVPPIDEQKQIVKYLDKETTKIDTLIDKQEQMIALLQEKRQAIISHAVTRGLNPNVKMKDSGIEWLGEVPAHWVVTQIKYVAQINPSKSELKTIPLDTPVTFLPMESIGETGRLDIRNSKPLSEVISAGYTYLAENDVIIAKITPCFENGKGAIATGLLNGIAFATTEVVPFRCFRIHNQFLYFLLSSSPFRKIAEGSMYGAGGQKRVSDTFFANYKCCIPPADEEQKQIAAFLDSETTKIDTLIKKCETAIELLKERRTALISAAVTGKIDVRDIG